MTITYEEAKQYFLTEKLSLSTIEKLYQYDRKLLSKQLSSEDIQIVKNNQKYTYNVEFFSDINSEEKAYWLGFLYADGYVQSKGKVHTLQIALKNTDTTHLHKLKKVLCPDNILSEKIIRRKDKEYKAVKLTITNKIIVEQLILLGCVNSKSKIIRFPTLAPELLRHFIRGYFDGDGAIGKYDNKLVWSVCSGSEDFIKTLQKTLQSSIVGYTEVSIKKDKRGEVYCIQKGGNPSVSAILKYLYADSTVWLDRKYTYFNSLPSAEETLRNISAE